MERSSLLLLFVGARLPLLDDGVLLMHALHRDGGGRHPLIRHDSADGPSSGRRGGCFSVSGLALGGCGAGIDAIGAGAVVARGPTFLETLLLLLVTLALPLLLALHGRLATLADDVWDGLDNASEHVQALAEVVAGLAEMFFGLCEVGAGDGGALLGLVGTLGALSLL